MRIPPGHDPDAPVPVMLTSFDAQAYQHVYPPSTRTMPGLCFKTMSRGGPSFRLTQVVSGLRNQGRTAGFFCAPQILYRYATALPRDATACRPAIRPNTRARSTET